MTYGISDNSGVCKFSFGGRQEKGSKLEIKRLHMLSTDESCRKKNSTHTYLTPGVQKPHMEELAAGAMQNLGWRNRRLEKSMVVMLVPSVNVVNVTKSQHMTQYNVHEPTCEDSRLGASDR